jgi:hypothetical protein
MTIPDVKQPSFQIGNGFGLFGKGTGVRVSLRLKWSYSILLGMRANRAVSVLCLAHCPRFIPISPNGSLVIYDNLAR